LRESNEVSARAISAGGRPYHVEKEVTLISSERLAIIVLPCERGHSDPATNGASLHVYGLYVFVDCADIFEDWLSYTGISHLSDSFAFLKGCLPDVLEESCQVELFIFSQVSHNAADEFSVLEACSPVGGLAFSCERYLGDSSVSAGFDSPQVTSFLKPVGQTCYVGRCHKHVLAYLPHRHGSIFPKYSYHAVLRKCQTTRSQLMAQQQMYPLVSADNAYPRLYRWIVALHLIQRTHMVPAENAFSLKWPILNLLGRLSRGRLVLREDEILGFIEKTVTPFGKGAKVDCPKEYIGKRAYIVVCRK